MKKLVIIISLLFTTFLFSFSQKDVKKPNIKIPINTTVTDDNGCTVHINGTIDITVNWDLSVTFNSFDGTLTLGGGKGCPQGTLTFSKSAGADLGVSINDNNPCSATDISWTANVSNARTTYATNVLNMASAKSIVLSEIQSASSCN